MSSSKGGRKVVFCGRRRRRRRTVDIVSLVDHMTSNATQNVQSLSP